MSNHTNVHVASAGTGIMQGVSDGFRFMLQAAPFTKACTGQEKRGSIAFASIPSFPHCPLRNADTGTVTWYYLYNELICTESRGYLAYNSRLPS